LECTKPSYSALGARGIADGTVANEVGEVAFNEPDGFDPSGAYENRFRKTITWVTAGSPPQSGSGMSALDFLEQTSMFKTLSVSMLIHRQETKP
jgi:hypothetical protein